MIKKIRILSQLITDNYYKWLFYALIIILPFVLYDKELYEHNKVRAPQYIFFSGVVLLLIALSHKNKLTKIFLAYCVLNTAIIFPTLDGLFGLFTIFIAIWLIGFISKIDEIILKKCLITTGYGVGIYWLFISSIKNTWPTGAYLAFIIPIALSINARLAIPLIIGVFISKSMMAIIAACIGICLYLILKETKWKTYIVICLIFCAVIVSCQILGYLPKDQTTIKRRLQIWEDSFKHIGFTWFGTGLRSYKTYDFMSGKISKTTHAHNEYIEVYCELGAVGLSMLIAYIFTLYCVKCPIEYKSMLSAILMHNLGYYAMRLAPTGLLAIICIGLILKYKNERGIYEYKKQNTKIFKRFIYSYLDSKFYNIH